MAEVSNDLIYEVLKAMQTRLGTVDEGLREVRGELKGMRISLQAQQVQMNAVQTDVGNLYEAFGALDSRLARIERRLDITDAPVS
ncbi:hypothetical protein MKK75_19515 [Methylobacterium sp. J-030]|uniref:hypothetical protein n=1 Tax=Methylobacterium sp. J-030 TaxID=2836627 RepID=UPI001FBB701F|nr:hypothetical protein [Methylobacterium sp. J-030]MCJ2070952.1 hypothetical protein [Methylobacterium sp. J-030]